MFGKCAFDNVCEIDDIFFKFIVAFLVQMPMRYGVVANLVAGMCKCCKSS